MTKIKNIKHLRKELKRLRLREKELMQEINSGWKHLRGSLSPSNIVEEQLRNCKEHRLRRGDGSILKSILSFAATLLISKLVKKTEEKVEEFFS
jgi:hypothetical protein